MTSMDCPVCKQSFKLTKSEDPNEAWDRHFSTTCTQQPGQDKTPLQCASSTCTATLGPSNRFQCPRCLQLVCLRCRTVEAHQCSAVPVKGAKRGYDAVTAARLSKLGGTSSSAASSDKDNSNKHNNNNKSNSSIAKPRVGNGGKSDSSNTLLGSAQRRKTEQQQQQQRRVATQSTPYTQTVGVVPPAPGGALTSMNESFDCPLCSQKFRSSVDLVQHVDTAHNMQSPPSAPTTSSSAAGNSVGSTSSSTNLPEVCPTCSQRFPDVMSLIHHAEVAHAGLGEGSTNSSGVEKNCSLS
eukprot:CAMPEP_0114431710 /NCGR_PEP_ID=MMETSP0103-20121206/10755_1 /TAXON_ID=37642 ORGANISM="Paraphysomonas imperforata, Strain PA2" /NCGR_SAMPLE_ID=MMETSP0103 /ASSEMBLY_ACC=CAM_ASM_000201 /LENGTH=295 /DNA_ID=CAMNT_0001601313 /DNA_START=270 /DNA_END=1157 /DNA_ORIENTATION=+